MTELHKETILAEIESLLRQTVKDYPKHNDKDVIHIDMGELSTYETLFNAIYSKGEISEDALAINRSFRDILSGSHKILENKLEIILKKMIV